MLRCLSRYAVLIGMVFLFTSSRIALTQADGQLPPHLETQSGEVLLLTVQVTGINPVVTGTFRDRTIPFFRMDSSGYYGGLLGIDLAEEPVQEEVRIHVQEGPKTRVVQRYQVKINGGEFGIQELTLPKETVDLDEETLKRVEGEQQIMIENLSGLSQEKFWRGPFILPVEGKVAGTFGRRRIINGQPRSAHSGEDIYAPQGTPVLASNHGVVKLTGDFFFSGKSIVLDHGLGVFTMYFHLSEILVKEGEQVSKGKTIGRVGATGRVTGPHLHWGMRVNGARVNPFSLLNLPLSTQGTE